MNVQLKGKQGKPSVRDAIEQDIVTGFYSPATGSTRRGLRPGTRFPARRYARP